MRNFARAIGHRLAYWVLVVLIGGAGYVVELINEEQYAFMSAPILFYFFIHMMLEDWEKKYPSE